MKINNLTSPASHNIFPGTVNRVFDPNKEAAKIARENARDRKLFEATLGRNKQQAPQIIFPGTLHSTFEPETRKVSVTEKEVREAYALAQKALAQGKIPPKAGQGRNLDLVV